MRTNIRVGLALTLVLGFTSTALAAEEPQALVSRAIQASGGEAKLAKVKAGTWKETGTYYGMGEGVPYQGNYAQQLPDKHRMEIVGFFTRIVNGDKGWIIDQGGNVQEMPKEELDEMRESLYGHGVARLVGLKDKAFTLTPAGEAQVEGQTAFAVNVASKGHRDVKLFFDKKTGLLVKLERRAKAPEQGNQEVTAEIIYSNHKDVNGVKIPTKILVKHDGKKLVEAEHSDFKFEDKLDEKLFSKP